MRSSSRWSRVRDERRGGRVGQGAPERKNERNTVCFWLIFWFVGYRYWNVGYCDGPMMHFSLSILDLDRNLALTTPFLILNSAPAIIEFHSIERLPSP